MAKKNARAPLKRGRKPPGVPITAREIKFVQNYFQTDNAVQSWIDAGFVHASREAAQVAANDALRKPLILAYLQQLSRAAAAAAMVTVEELAAFVRNCMLGDRRKFFTATGEPLLPHEWPDDVAEVAEDFDMDTVTETTKAKDGTEETRGRAFVKKLKTVSRLAAASKLMEWRKMLGPSADGPPQDNKPLVVKGADPDKL